MDDYSTILNRMKENFKSIAGYYPSDASDSGIRLRTYASEILDCMVYANWLKDQMFVETADSESLDKHAQSYGLTRLSGTRACGEVTFGVTEALNREVIIPQNTLLYSDQGIGYVTDSRAILPVGATSVNAPVTAVEIGSLGNAGAGDVHIFDVPMEDIETVSNQNPISGGTDFESDEDLRIRLRSIAAFPATGSNLSYYEQLAAQVEGISSVKLLPNRNGVGTMVIYAGGSGQTPGVSVMQNLQIKMETFGEATVTFTCVAASEVAININASISVKDGFFFPDVESQCSAAVRNYLSTRKVAQKVSEDEIIRRIMSVDGVKECIMDPDNEIPDININEMAVLGAVTITQA